MYVLIKCTNVKDWLLQTVLSSQLDTVSNILNSGIKLVSLSCKLF